MRNLAFILILLLAACTSNNEQPNILFFFSDDHTSQAISAYGDGRIETPNIDRLAEEGVLFENCFCTNAICAPSRAVVLTGKYSHLNGVKDNSLPFDGSQQTFVKILKNSGYRTAIIGKWHLKSEPTGFDYWQVLPGQGKYFNPDFIEMGENITREGYVTDIITEQAAAWIENYNYDEPFCLLLHHKAPHADWEWPDELKDEFIDEFPLPENFHDDYQGRQAAAYSRLKVDTAQWNIHYRYRFGDYPYKNPEQMYQRYMNDYMRCIRAVDNSVGRIMEVLDKSRFADNTVVIYSSDQGFFLGEHGLYDKRFMYEESLRMPLIVKGSRHKAEGRRRDKGKRIEHMVLSVDFAPTILDIAGIEIPGDMQGVSFLPLLSGENPINWRTSMYYHFYENAYDIGEHEGIRTHQHKLIHFLYPEESWELFDLKKDPGEMSNIFGGNSQKELTSLLIKKMDSLKAAVNYH